MRTRKIGKKTMVYFTYIEWLGSGKAVPPLPEGEILGEKVQYVISDIPEDKQEYFVAMGWLVRLATNKGKGFKTWEETVNRKTI